MLTKPQDIVVALKLCLQGSRQSYAEMGQELGMSASEVHAAVRHAEIPGPGAVGDLDLDP